MSSIPAPERCPDGAMTVLETKLNELRDRLFVMAAITEEMLSGSMKALVERDPDLARRIIELDEPKVNRYEIDIEDAAIELIALYQPEATNLRTITMVIKINNDLERIGDHAVNIAESAQFLMDRPAVKPLVDLPKMAEQAISMLKDSLDAFCRKDVELARRVCERDSVVDGLKRDINAELAQVMAKNPATIERALKLMTVALNLERVADLATNIAEDAIYMAMGQVIKHRAGGTEENLSAR